MDRLAAPISGSAAVRSQLTCLLLYIALSTAVDVRMEYNDLTGTIPYDIDQLQKLGTFVFWKSVYRHT